jgi:hypothetical protein
MPFEALPISEDETALHLMRWRLGCTPRWGLIMEWYVTLAGGLDPVPFPIPQPCKQACCAVFMLPVSRANIAFCRVAQSERPAPKQDFVDAESSPQMQRVLKLFPRRQSMGKSSPSSLS